MVDTKGDIKEAGPSIAVQMQGLSGVPAAGDSFRVCDSEAEVRRVLSCMHGHLVVHSAQLRLLPPPAGRAQATCPARGAGM